MFPLLTHHHHHRPPPAPHVPAPITSYVIIYQKKYLLYTPVKGLTRLDIWPPAAELLEAPLSDLPYCNTTIAVSQTGRYKTPTMAAPWEQLSCQRCATTRPMSSACCSLVIVVCAAPVPRGACTCRCCGSE